MTPQKIFSFLKIITKKFWEGLGRFDRILKPGEEFLRLLGREFSARERWLLWGAGTIFLATALVGTIQRYYRTTQLTPVVGGSYSEGMVVGSSSEIDSLINHLTQVGLTELSPEGRPTPAAASRWEISADTKVYTFYLRESFSAPDIKTLFDASPVFAGIKITAPESQQLVFSLDQSYAPFLATLSEPLIPGGPFSLKKRDKNKLVFEKNPRFFRGPPFLDQFTILIFPDQEQLEGALKNGQLDGVTSVVEASSGRQTKPPAGFRPVNFSLPRYLMVFFNTTRPPLDKKEIRRKFLANQPLGQSVNLHLVTSSSEKNLEIAQGLKDRWQPIGVNLEVISRDPVAIERETIPSRDYDLLLYGIDFGRDPDRYPFWHSSQITDKGLNLANFSTRDLDKLLEQARQEIDPVKRADLEKKISAILDDEVPAITLEQSLVEFLVSTKIKGVEVAYGVSPLDHFSTVEKWYIKEKRVHR